MNDTTFQQEYLGHWEPSNKQLYDLAEEYHKQCEFFDQLHCSGVNERGIAVPVNGGELGLINKHALEVRKDIICRAAHLGYTKEEVIDAIHYISIYL